MGLTALVVSSCGKSPKAALDSLQRQFWTNHTAFTSTKPLTYLTVEQWEVAVRQCADAEDYAARFLALAKAHPKTEVAGEALSWIIAYFPETASAKEAVELYSRDYSESFPAQCRGLIQPAAPYGDHYFRAIIEKSSSREMQGRAMLARARFRQTVMHDNATAEKLLELVAARYADIEVGGGRSVKLGDLVKDDLVNLRNPDLAPRTLSAGQKAPPFETTTIDGKTVRFPENYKGKVVLLEFWATWCGPCVKEVPNVVDVYEQFHSQGLEVLSISLDQENAAGILAQFVKKHKMPWPQIYDGKYVDTTVARCYGINGIPHALVVDGDTGLIMAEGDDARGQKLAAAIESAFAARRPARK
jgi:peroxiredoxin